MKRPLAREPARKYGKSKVENFTVVCSTETKFQWEAKKHRRSEVKKSEAKQKISKSKIGIKKQRR